MVGFHGNLGSGGGNAAISRRPLVKLDMQLSDALQVGPGLPISGHEALSRCSLPLLGRLTPPPLQVN
ncbi:hypothetical protein EYF80_051954 [Liparis tanakae]|uniref:Uncharacterized protein n=1 Tax=Liparis tanakae TaxID=230148 RepID=A0A4Z2FAG8_9TELE|nr:hypothetical protein EYF80_051954 [Liparis tanakae]